MAHGHSPTAASSRNYSIARMAPPGGLFHPLGRWPTAPFRRTLFPMLHKGAAQASRVLVPGAKPGSGEIAVQFLTTAAQFARLAPESNRIHGHAASARAFNSWLCRSHWWRGRALHNPLLPLAPPARLA